MLIGRIAVLQERYWAHLDSSENPQNSRDLGHEVTAPTLRSVLGLLHIPSDPQPSFTVTYSHGYGHEGLIGMHFSVVWSPNGGYERGFLEVFHDEKDTSMVSGAAISTVGGREAAEREAIVKLMLANASNPFLQARVLADLSGLFAEPRRA